MDFQYWDRAPVGGFSLRQARRLMATVSADAADAIRHARNRVVHHSSVELQEYPLANLSVDEQVTLLRELAKCAPRTPFAQLCEDMAGDLRLFAVPINDRMMTFPEVDVVRSRSLLLTHGAVEFVARLWRLAEQLEELRGQQIALGEGHHRRLRVLKAAEVPLWALNALAVMPEDGLKTMTPKRLLELSDRGDAGTALAARDSDEARLLREAEAVLDLLRVLTVLGMEPTSWNEFLSQLAQRLEPHDTIEASRVMEFEVPPRPCRPPGELVMADPRVPRAPGFGAPRRPSRRGRSQLHHHGRRRGRPVV
ncbi:hypothetical protein [Streptomyces sp. NPDC056144]|uniref:hypothetical protein n=1 Tax=unclassified Streptomyces TaxID=2593676 RepID=UPI0035D784B3